MQLEWRSKEDVDAALAASPNGQGYDLLLGADICYNDNFIPHLFTVASRLLRRNARPCRAAPAGSAPAAAPASSAPSLPCFLLGYMSRSAATDRLVLQQAEAHGFDLVEVPGTRRKAACGLTGWVYLLRSRPAPGSAGWLRSCWQAVKGLLAQQGVREGPAAAAGGACQGSSSSSSRLDPGSSWLLRRPPSEALLAVCAAAAAGASLLLWRRSPAAVAQAGHGGRG